MTISRAFKNVVTGHYYGLYNLKGDDLIYEQAEPTV